MKISINFMGTLCWERASESNQIKEVVKNTESRLNNQ